MVGRVLTIVLLSTMARIAGAHPASGIVVDAQGQVFFCQHGHAVWKIDAQGKLTPFHEKSFHWLALDTSGVFARSEAGNFFERVTPVGAKPALVMGSDFPFVINAEGHLFYEDARGGVVRIVKRTPAGRESILVTGGRGQGQATELLDAINDMALGPDGSLYVSQRDAIRKIGTDGRVLTTAARIVDPECSTDLPPGLPNPPFLRGLAVDRQGTVYAAATSCRSVLTITPDGKVTVLARATAPWSPTGVAVANSAVYILEHSNPLAEGGPGVPRIRKVDPDKKITTLATVTENPKSR